MIGRLIAIALLVAAAAHAAFVLATPRLIMNVAIERIGEGAFNAWRHAPRVDETARGVVRPSPDLAYSACAYDLSRGPVRVSVAPGEDYVSLSLYADNTDNYFVRSDREAPRGIDIVLAQRGQDLPRDAEIVFSPSARGLALVRRLAPDAAGFARADAARQEDTCALL